MSPEVEGTLTKEYKGLTDNHAGRVQWDKGNKWCSRETNSAQNKVHVFYVKRTATPESFPSSRRN